ncbi:hypothetical protein M0804_011085 [Polistes exclamans]|nr:hypothetical protein M0804_011085 [Polistes exclamans]
MHEHGGDGGSGNSSSSSKVEQHKRRIHFPSDDPHDSHQVVRLCNPTVRGLHATFLNKRSFEVLQHGDSNIVG